MDHLAYYNTGCEPEPGLSRPKLWVRRQFRKILLPASKRMVQILTSLCHRLDIGEAAIRELQDRCNDLHHRQHDLAAKYPATIAFGWDYVAMTRRLAVLEEHVDILLAERERLLAGASIGGAEPLAHRAGRETAA